MEQRESRVIRSIAGQYGTPTNKSGSAASVRFSLIETYSILGNSVYRSRCP
jgi:hypothetical protein